MWEGTSLYLRHTWVLSRSLLYPLFAQLVGIFLWLGLTYVTVDWLTLHFPALNLWLLWGIFLLVNLPGMILFLRGFWGYMVWVSALNLVIRELVETGTCDDLSASSLRITCRAADYTLIWSFLFGVIFVPFGLAMLPITVLGTHPEWYVASLILAVLIVFVGLIIACTLLIFFSLVFQVFAYTPGSAGASLFRSMDLVGQGILKTLAITALTVVSTQFLLPWAVTGLSQWVGLTALLSHGLEFAINYAITRSAEDILTLQTEYPLLTAFFRLLAANPNLLAVNIVETIIYSLASALLLPLGTCWFALLYADLKTAFDQNQQLPVPVEAAMTVA